MKIKQKKLDALLVKKDSLLKKLHSFDFFMKGSITTIHRTVNNKKYPGLFFLLILMEKQNLFIWEIKKN